MRTWMPIGLSLALLSFARAADGDAATIPPPKAREAAVSFQDIGKVEFESPPEGCVIRYTLNGSAPTAQSNGYCTPIRVASSLKVKAACFKADGSAGAPVEVACTRIGADAKDVKPTAAINIDFSEVPDLKDWALRAQKDADDYYPVICEKLSSDGFVAPRQILFVFKETKGIAFTTGTQVTFARGWIQAHPDDTGTVVHELTHVIQQYKGKAPGWLTEGIADYIRWQNWEPLERRRKLNPKQMKYTNGYNDAAAFLAWIEKNRDKDIVRKLNEALRKNTYSDELFKTHAGGDIPTLWKEFIDSLSKT